MATVYTALVVDACTNAVVGACPIADAEGHEAVRRAALRYGISKGVGVRRGGRVLRRPQAAGRVLSLYVVTVDGDGIATDHDRFHDEDWFYSAGSRHVTPRRTWALPAAKAAIASPSTGA